MEYLSGKYSQYEIIRRHEISSRSVLQRWVKHYNSHRELKDTIYDENENNLLGGTNSNCPILFGEQ
ncbi:hypothetical protein [Bacillus thuringiensis]|uniref:hypothetical protein n=1 Tax=Bacillus thuringiensis TaxID=1428 RepID=UPI003C6D9438